MLLKKILAPLATAAAIFIAPAAYASTVASVAAQGKFADNTVGIFVDVTSFTASFDPTVDPTAIDDYELSASLDIAGNPVFSEAVVIPGVSIEDLAVVALSFVFNLDPNILDALVAIGNVIETNDGNPVDIGFGQDFAFSGGPFTVGPASISGPFSFSFADNGETAPTSGVIPFAVSAQISTVAPVPLPASALFLIAGLGGLAATRRLSRKS